MENIKGRSLAELEDLYQKQLQHWTSRMDEALKQVQACEQQMTAFDQKLRHIQALVNGPEAAATPVKVARATKSVKKRRKGPIRDATLTVLRNRPGQKLTVAQIRTAIRKDTHKRASRQAVNVNVDMLEEAGLVGRERAPKGSGGRFVFWAV